MVKKSQLAQKIEKKLSQRTSLKTPVTLSLNEVNYKRLQKYCEDFNKKVDTGNTEQKKINVSLIIDELLAQFLGDL